jgi:amino acid transporter
MPREARDVHRRPARPGAFDMRFLDLLLGRRIATDEDENERVGTFAGVGVLGLDALASAAYGPEALLTALLPLGAAALDHVWLLTCVIIALLLLVGASYAQTIVAYTNGGGAYTVAKENLGTRPSLVAAAALAMDYVLNVAVAISAGVGALASAVPAVLPYTLPLCLAILALLTLINLRGVRSTGIVVLLPTYAFIACLLTVIVVGVFSPAPAAPASAVAASAPGPIGWGLAWLLLQAFANGCTAMTGVEALSNGVPIFEKPSAVKARRTLALIIGLLVLLLAGIAFSARRFSIVATLPAQPGYESVLSQLARATVGQGPLYYVTMGSIFMVLGLSANTSFADFPRVCRVLAQDKFLPEPFVHRGRRLAFSHGIWVLAGLSAVLLVAFHGVTDHLIPLFALGALSAFTMSQAGMVAHWWRRRGRGARAAGVLNLLGALATGLTLLVVLVSKLKHGAWISVLLVLGMLLVFRAVRRHYDFIAHATQSDATLELGPLDAPIAVVPMRRWDAVALKALLMAAGMSREVIVVQVLTGDREVDDLTPRWATLVEEPARRLGFPTPRLIVEHSRFRDVFAPLLDVVETIAREHRGRPIAVFVPELVEPRWYHYLLHGHTAALLRQKLRARGGPQLVIVSTPWYLENWLPERRWLRAFTRRWWRRSASEGIPSSAWR